MHSRLTTPLTAIAGAVRLFAVAGMLVLGLVPGGVQAQDTATTGNASSVETTQRNALCALQLEEAAKKARARGLSIQLERDSKFFEYQISGAYAAQCIGQLIKYADRMQSAIDGVYTAAHKGDVAKAAITLVATQLLEAAYRQLVSALENQVCSITNQVTQAMDSALNNAICLPSGGIGGLGNMFAGNINLNLPNLQCDGFAVDMVGFFDADPMVNWPTNEVGNFSVGAGVMSITPGTPTGAPPQQMNGLLGAGWDRNSYGLINEGTPVMVTGWDTITGSVPSGSVGAVCSSGGGVDGFINALGTRESGSGTSPQCQNYSRVGLSGRSTSPYTCINSSGFVGRYQFGEAMLHDLAARGVVASAFRACQPHPSTACFDNRYGNTAALQQFLNDPAAQERAIRAELDMNWRVMQQRGVDRYIGTTVGGVTLTKSGLLAAAHLIGAGGVMNALATGRMTADGNGVKWIDYARHFANC